MVFDSNCAQALVVGLVELTCRIMSLGRSWASSNRLNASKGLVVKTPPKSQRMASIDFKGSILLIEEVLVVVLMNPLCVK